MHALPCLANSALTVLTRTLNSSTFGMHADSSKSTCQHVLLVLQAKPSMTKSSVVDNVTGKSMDSTVRTSTGTFFGRGQDEVLAAVEKRIAQVRPDCITVYTHSYCSFLL